MIQAFKKENKIVKYQVQDGKVLCTIEIDGRWVSNPSLEVFKSQGWEEYTLPPPEIPEVDYERLYEQRVVGLIRELYSEDDEFAILRQRDTKPDEFQIYFDYCEQCKEQAHREIAEMQESNEEEESDDEE